MEYSIYHTYSPKRAIIFGHGVLMLRCITPSTGMGFSAIAIPIFFKIDGKYSTSYACHFANSRMKYYIFYIKIQKAFEKFREGCNAFTVLGNQRGSIFMEIIHKSRLFLDVLSQIVRIAGFPECIFFFFYL